MIGRGDLYDIEGDLVNAERWFVQVAEKQLAQLPAAQGKPIILDAIPLTESDITNTTKSQPTVHK